MKVEACAALRRKLAAGEPTFGVWVTMESVAITEIAVGAGLSYVVVDCEHGHLDFRDVIAHVRGAVRSETCVFVRVAPSAYIDLPACAAQVKRLLDIGADGIIFPNVETPEQLAELVRFTRYPPHGVRGIGAERATAFGSAIVQHVAECAEQPPFAIPILESHKSFLNRDGLAAVDGVELFWCGPADHSATKGFTGQWEGGDVAEEVRAICTAVRAKNKNIGVVCTDPANVVQRREEGFRLLCLGMDAQLLIRGLRSMLSLAGGEVTLNTELKPKIATTTHADEAGVACKRRRTQAAGPFRVALTPDFYDASGKPLYRDFGLCVFEKLEKGLVSQSCMAPMTPGNAALAPAQLKGAHGAVVLATKVTAESLSGGGADDLLAVSRFGVGYDSVDVAACTRNDVLVLISAGAVDHSMAEATVTWMLGLTHRTFEKHALVAEGGWSTRSKFMGDELRDRTFGAVGFGGIASATVRILSSFGMQPPIVYDPFLKAADAAAAGVRLVTLDELLRTADFVSVHCPLNDKTRGLIGKEALAKMKPTAYLLNTARGGIVDEQALTDALQAGKIAGAALDCFAEEPLTAPLPLAKLPRVATAPHCIGWTHELFRDIGAAACGALAELAQGRRPKRGVINPEVFEQPGFQRKWERALSGQVGSS